MTSKSFESDYITKETGNWLPETYYGNGWKVEVLNQCLAIHIAGFVIGYDNTDSGRKETDMVIASYGGF